jgi:hypothetical protein
VIVEGAERQPAQPEHVAATKVVAAATQGLEVEVSTLEDDERIPPLGLLIGSLGSRGKDEHPKIEGGGAPPGEEGEPVPRPVH